jgi:hypothetical protein
VMYFHIFGCWYHEIGMYRNFVLIRKSPVKISRRKMGN